MEFDLIQRYFKQPFDALRVQHAHTVPTGIGDDCAALQLPPEQRLYVSTDTLVGGVHFFEDENPEFIGWKALACNVSDLAASGAQALGFTLCLSIPTVDHAWLHGFSKGLLACAEQFACPLVGGDTTGSGRNTQASITIGVMGYAPNTHSGFHRACAAVGDTVWVSGVPGLARLGLLLQYQARGLRQSPCDFLNQLPESIRTQAQQALLKPHPRLQLGLALRGMAHAAVDLSDGLSGDLGHVAKASGVQLCIEQPMLMQLWIRLWPELAHPSRAPLLRWLCEVSCVGGDDFELCWTAPSQATPAIRALTADCELTAIGSVQQGQGVCLHNGMGQSTTLNARSFDHFSEEPT